jgi:hypothetical protein
MVGVLAQEGRGNMTPDPKAAALSNVVVTVTGECTEAEAVLPFPLPDPPAAPGTARTPHSIELQLPNGITARTPAGLHHTIRRADGKVELAALRYHVRFSDGRGPYEVTPEQIDDTIAILRALADTEAGTEEDRRKAAWAGKVLSDYARVVLTTYARAKAAGLDAQLVEPATPRPPTEAPAPAKLPARPQPLRPAIRFKSDNVHAATVRALSTVQDWQKDIIEGFAYGMKQEYRRLEVTVGLPDSSQAEDLWTYLAKGGARMVKAHYALWGRWFEDGGRPGKFATVNINQFCADLGYTPHHNGGFKRERKQEAVRILEALTAVEMRATFTPPGKKAAQRLRGPLWSRGLLAEENDQYEDLFGQARAGDPNLWEPLAFSYAPGPWFSNPDWARYNRAIGKIGAGLMRLANDKDEWAILIGGYLGTLVRVNHYAPLRLRVDTILRAANLAQGRDARRRLTETQEKFSRALDRLVEVGVIASWTWPETDAAELSDPDDPAAVAAYYAADPLPKGDCRARLVEITLPAEMEEDRVRLDAAQARAIQASMRRRRTPKKDAGTDAQGK